MAPSGTPWNSWGSAFPGSVEKGPWPCYIIMFGPLVIYLAQAIYAQRLFSKKHTIDKHSISKFYSNLIILNIAAMALVTGPSTINGLIVGYVRGYDGAVYPTTPLILWYLTIFAFGLVHSVNNCCRIVFDAFGLRAAIWFIPVASSFQLWQVLALPFGFDPYLGVVVLTGIDYLEHLIALMYWLFRLCSAQNVDDKKRLWCGVCGVLLHMISIIPVLIYVTRPVEVQTTGGLCAVYITVIVLMFASQMFWIRMALLTPRPSDMSSGGEESKDMFDEDVHEYDA